MRKAVYMIVGLVFTLAFASCVDEEEFSDDPRGNFEALWKIIDEHYCFFDYKNEAYGLNWNEVYAKYSKQVSDGMTDDWLFEVLGNMLGELRDGHVNMYAPFDNARYWSWKEDYPANFSDSLLRRYLGTDYKIASGLEYRKLDDNIGYVYCPSFANGIGDGNLDEVMLYLAPCNGLILDIRGNGGGQLTTAEKLAGRMMFGKMDSATSPENCYILVFARDGKVVAVLDKGHDARLNFTTGKSGDRLANYNGYGIIWFLLY